MTNRICWSVATRLARTLGPQTAEAMLGDLWEAGASGGRAVVAVAGAIGRAWWIDRGPRPPWLAVVLLGPGGWTIGSTTSHHLATTSIYGWLYWDQWTWGHLASAGARAELLLHLFHVTAGWVLLLLATGVGGYVAGQTTARFGRGVLLVFIFSSASSVALGLHSSSGPNAVVFAHAFYRIGVPAVSQVGLAAVAWLTYARARRSSAG